MKMQIKNKWPVAALSLMAVTSGLSAAAKSGMNDGCAPQPPATCYPGDCKTCYCVGPENYGVNAPVRPKTCDGDVLITASALYWVAHQDGMEFAIRNNVANPGTASLANITQQNQLTDAKFLNPHFNWDFGFKLGIGYNSPCDGWDVSATWTWFTGRGHAHPQTEINGNDVLLPLLSAYSPLQSGPLYATDVEVRWHAQINLVDLELGREFWVSKYVTMRPHVGIRIGFIDEMYKNFYKNGSWGTNAGAPNQVAYNGETNMQSNFRGAGLRAGLDTVWNIGCGWGLYGDLALALISGRFHTKHEESTKTVSAPHTRDKFIQFTDHIRGSRPTVDLALGIQWATLLCECKYGFTAQLGWEQHIFFDQNQFFAINRVGDTVVTTAPNLTGENVIAQRRGNLDTQGVTLTLRLEF